MNKKWHLGTLTIGILILFLQCSCENKTKHSDLSRPSRLRSKHAPADQFFLQRSFPDDHFSDRAFTGALDQARAQMTLRLTPPLGFSETWATKGPGNIGARVNAIAVHPGNEQIIYAGFSSGGLYKTTNGGNSWFPIFDDRAYLAIGAIAIDPNNPETIYVGTGDPNITGYPFLGDGLYRSTNGGQNWTRIGLEDTRIISKIIIDPSNSLRIHVGAMGLPFERNRQRGLYTTNDGGKTWKQSLFVSEKAGICDIVIDPLKPNILYAASWTRIRNNHESIINGPDSGIFKSTNSGQTWTRLSGGGWPSGNLSRIGLAFYSGNPDLVFAIVVNTDSQMQNIYRSADGGTSWEPLIVFGQSNLPSTVLGGMGWYFGKIAVNPNNPAELFVLSISLWKTSDGGKFWTPVGDGYIHSDKHELVYLPSGAILVGSDGGINQSGDGGKTWTDIESIPTTQFYRVDYNPNVPSLYYGGAQDHGTVSGSSLAQNWRRMEGGDGFQMRFHPTDPNIMWAQTQNGTIRASTDGGFTFQLALRGIDRNDRINWDAPLVLSKHDPNVLYAATHRVYKNSTGVAALWQAISPDLTDGDVFGRNFHTISCLDESAINADVLMAGTSDGNVWYSSNAGANWNRVDAGLPERYVTAVKTSPSKANTFYVSHSGYRDNDNFAHIHISRDQGKSWSSLAGDMPPLAINDILILPGYQDNVLFAATDGGVYASVNAGKNWDRLGSNLPIIAAYSLAWNVAKNELVVGTHGKSILAYPLQKLLTNVVTKTRLTNLPNDQLKAYPLPFQASLNLDWELPIGDQAWKLVVFDGSGKVVFAQNLSNATRGTQLNTQYWSKGLYFIQLSNGMSQISRKVIKS